MPTIHKRTQHAVGQGFFHTGALVEDSSVHLRYVVDCGASKETLPQLFQAVKGYRQTIAETEILDVLFITHAHYDHLSGVVALVKDLKVDTIVMPMIDVADRLYAYAHAVDNGAVVEEGSFFQTFIADPIEATVQLGSRRIFVIESGDGSGAPFSRTREDNGDGRNSASDDLNDPSFRTRVVGRGTPHSSTVSENAQGTRVVILPDTMALASDSSAQFWLLAPYVDNAVAHRRTAFLKELASELDISLVLLEQRLLDNSFIQRLLTKKKERAKLVAAYYSVEPDLNVTSLCVYSGPPPTLHPPKATCDSKLGRWAYRTDHPEKISWLGTGDAALSENDRYDAFAKHFLKLLHFVQTLALPHHGSTAGFNLKLVTDIEADFYVAAATMKYEKHPATLVMQEIASTGRFLSVVNASAQSEVVEEITLL